MIKLESVDGLMFDSTGMHRCEIDVRVTVDALGASISFAVDRTVMLQVPVERIKNILEFALGGVKNDG